jgi:hypothetical protein
MVRVMTSARVVPHGIVSGIAVVELVLSGCAELDAQRRGYFVLYVYGLAFGQCVLVYFAAELEGEFGEEGGLGLRGWHGWGGGGVVECVYPDLCKVINDSCCEEIARTRDEHVEVVARLGEAECWMKLATRLSKSEGLGYAPRQQRCVKNINITSLTHLAT